MKTFRNLYPRVWSFENLLSAWRRAARGKRSRPDVADFELRLEDRLFEVATEPGDNHPYHPYRHPRLSAIALYEPRRDIRSGVVRSPSFGAP